MATENNNDDNFAAAFEKLSALGDKPITKEMDTPVTDAAVVTAAEAVAAKAEADKALETTAAATATGAAEEGGETELEDLTAEEKAAAEAGKTKPTPTAAEISERETALLAKFAQEMGKEKPKVEERVQPGATEPALFTAEEATFLVDFAKEWPDVAKAQQLQLTIMAKQVTGHIFSEIAKSLGPRLQMLEGLADRQHTADLHTSISDYDDVRDKVMEWVPKQPSYLRAAYERVISEGTVDEVADLIDRYRKDTGTVLTKPAATAVTAKPATELSTTAKKAAAALAPVGSKRTAAVSATGPDDFDGAFAEFAKELATT